jgi:3-deoxy-D-manno-octulosonic-acid transferase
VLADVDLALMQADPDAKRIGELGVDPGKIVVTGNLKFEQSAAEADSELTDVLRKRFGISESKPLIIAASTHDPEERYVLEAVDGMLGHQCRLLIAPRHPERFDAVAKVLEEYSYSFVRRSSPPSDTDKEADVILLDSIGELREAYPLAEIVFVGGSLIPHGGQSIIEPAAEGKTIVTGPYTHNFDSVVEEFRDSKALRQISTAPEESQISERLYEEFTDLLDNPDKRVELAANATALMKKSNRNATRTTVEQLRNLFSDKLKTDK